jgi:nucleotidyltransferase/DNA polymerase involved in DNA repair
VGSCFDRCKKLRLALEGQVAVHGRGPDADDPADVGRLEALGLELAGAPDLGIGGCDLAPAGASAVGSGGGMPALVRSESWSRSSWAKAEMMLIMAWAMAPRDIRNTLRRLVGVPVCIGIARTKTLAKLSNRTAKKLPLFDGVCRWESTRPEWRAKLMSQLPVSEVWGIAGRLEKRLASLGILSIADLAAADPVMIRDRFNVVVMRTVLELKGTPCIPFEEVREGKEQLIFSRSFSAAVTTRAEMRQVLAVYAEQGAARLEHHHQAAKILTAFAGTSHFAEMCSLPHRPRAPAGRPPQTRSCSPKRPSGSCPSSRKALATRGPLSHPSDVLQRGRGNWQAVLASTGPWAVVTSRMARDGRNG